MKDENIHIDLDEIIKNSSAAINNLNDDIDEGEAKSNSSENVTKQVEYIRNPLPLPKKRAHTGLDYAIDIDDNDDFDITDMTGMDYFDYE